MEFLHFCLEKRPKKCFYDFFLNTGCVWVGGVGGVRDSYFFVKWQLFSTLKTSRNALKQVINEGLIFLQQEDQTGQGLARTTDCAESRRVSSSVLSSFN